jgi:hypothetical protein
MLEGPAHTTPCSFNVVDCNTDSILKRNAEWKVYYFVYFPIRRVRKRRGAVVVALITVLLVSWNLG